MKLVDTELFGVVIVPEDFSEIINLANFDINNDRNIYMWRGQGDISWPIHSSAYRRLMKDRSHPLGEHVMRDYERELLLNAQHQGYHFENGRTLSDFELLAKLQHHGAATRMIDVSRNILVALWFACDSMRDKTGLVFGLHYSAINGFEGRPDSRSYNQVFERKSDLSTDEDDFNNDPTLWQPPVVTKRIAAQSAQFLYSRVSYDTSGSLSFRKDENLVRVIAITPEMKSKCLKILENTFDIRRLTLFPDIDGFCFSNSVNFGSHSNERW
ncbi:FRG domain-containing protein [Pectobacterium brasiliense]|uniref:FRG domain-containing protein n=1 Tax=Pectobacterium brasiliense TaxID=180957 RepID=UPI0015DE2B3D|nr:FRG domain-containing protein [Pectobacterium brasiliense]MBA0195948.1 FRG domain-containing protein [Pectobacterium brasiliense]MBN3094316.1 FRG domain-containing protein [Pectobacterium brasiliense]MBN3139701.1 FRG domain-containing protein [Pectobacterium brasiliense]MBW5895032.1 FRG domain-containing protein [Pectobacterium brasiliense]